MSSFKLYNESKFKMPNKVRTLNVHTYSVDNLYTTKVRHTYFDWQLAHAMSDFDKQELVQNVGALHVHTLTDSMYPTQHD